MAVELRQSAPHSEPLSREDRVLDNTVEIVTPENIAFSYRLAGPFRRLAAYSIDLAVNAMILVALNIGLALMSIVVDASPLMILAVFLMYWFYGAAFEVYWNGQTPGKRSCGLRVLTIDGRPINGLQAVVRNVLRWADLLPLIPVGTLLQWWFGFGAPQRDEFQLPVPSFLVGLGAMSLSGRFQRLGDLVCGTIVVIEERQWLKGVARLEDPRAPQLAAYLPANFVVSRTLARALAHYVDRRRFFSPARRKEIAQSLARPLLARFSLPADTNYDLLLCALYYRTFVADRAGAAAMTGPSAPAPAAPLALPANEIYTSPLSSLRR